MHEGGESEILIVMTDSKIEQEEMQTLKSEAPRLDQINRDSEQSSAVFYSVKKNDARPQNQAQLTENYTGPYESV